MSDSKTTTQPQKSLNIFGQPLTIFDVPVDRETIFANHKGVYKTRIEKRQRKLIVRSTFIKHFLEPGERIFCLTTGYSPITVVEQSLTGLAFLYFKRAVLVFTEKRLLHIPARYGRMSSQSISQVLYEDCAHIELKRRSLVVKYKNGQQEMFPYIGRREKKKVKAFLAQIPLQPKEAGKLDGRGYLCPRCTHLLSKSEHTCPTCQLKFKSPLWAGLCAALLPGGGYFYARYPLMGIFTTALEIMLLGFLAIQWIDMKQGLPPQYGLMALLVGALVLVKVTATYHARLLVRNFMPVKKNIAVSKPEPKNT